MQNNEHSLADNIAPDSKDDTRDQVGKSSSGNAKPNDRISKLEVDSERRDAEANNEKTKHNGEEGAEGQEQRSNSERQWKSVAVEKAPGVYTDIGDRKGEANALMILANTHLLQHEHNQAWRLYSECLLVYTEIGEREGRAGALWGLAEVHRSRYKYSQAYALYSECLQIWTDIGERRARAVALRVLAIIHLLRKEYSQAIAFSTECLKIQTDIGDKFGRADALRTLAQVHQRREEYAQAFQLYSESLQISTDIGYKKGRGSALRGLAEVHWHHRGEHAQAAALYSECLAIYTDLGDKNGISTVSWDFAIMHLFHGNFRQAMALFPTPLKMGSINHFYGIQCWRASWGRIETKTTAVPQPTIRKNLEGLSEKLDSQWLQSTRRSMLTRAAGLFKLKKAA